MMGLAVPCLANVVLELTLFANPRLGFRDDLTVLFAGGWVLGLVCALAGVVAALVAAKSPGVWSFLAFFSGVILLNVLGFLWGLGAVANAFS